MAIDTKTAIIGALLIGVVTMAGWVGFLYVNPVTKTKTEEDEETVYITTYITEEEDPWGLPEDWSTAPNSTFITINNGTDIFQVSLGDILEGVALYQEQLEALEAGLGRINEYKDIIGLYHIQDPNSGSYFTGVDILDILAKYKTNFAYNLSFVSTKTPDGYSRTEYLNTSTGDIIETFYHGRPEEPFLLILAMNKGWLVNSPYGNFSIMHYVPADDPDPAEIKESLLNLEQINVESTWEVKIMINNTDNPDAFNSADFTTYYKIDPSNMTDNEFTANYSYSNDVDWNYNRQYWGRNISEIINIALTNAGYSDKNYTSRFWAADGYADPVPFGKSKEKVPWNITDIEEGFDPATRGDTVNDPPEPLPRSDLLMCLSYAQRELGEVSTVPTDLGSDPVWPNKKIHNYASGPFNIVVPGRLRSHYLKHVVEIRVTIFPEEIPPNYEDL